MGPFLELSESQKRQYIDAESIFLELRRAGADAAEVRGTMFWREQGGRKYLIRTNAAGGQKSLGAFSAETEQMHDRFKARKADNEARLATLQAAFTEQERMNKALRVGRVPDIVVKTLNALDAAGLQKNFMTIGTHSLYAYESACGIRFMPQAMATQDIDLLFDARKRIAFFSQLKRLDTSFVGALRKADPTFRVKSEQKQTAVNASGFEVDVIRRVARDGDPHPLRMSQGKDDEDDLWAVQIDGAERMLDSQRFDQVIVSATGRMALMTTMHPLTFVAIKRMISVAPNRDPLKRTKDSMQADLVEQLVGTHMPQYRRDSAEVQSLTGHGERFSAPAEG